MSRSRRPPPPGVKLSQAITKMGFTLKEFAHVSGVDATYLSAVANSRKPITVRFALRLERATGIPAEEWATLWVEYAIDLLRRGEHWELRRKQRQGEQ